jgi:O-acetyl-ADP-ribose deacetylase (regulator of RNase III)
MNKKQIHFVFFDREESFVEGYKEVLSSIPNTRFGTLDVNKMIDSGEVDAVVSPSNSYITMGGGIDYVYKKRFPNIDRKIHAMMVEKKYAKGEFEYRGSYYYLPIGKAIICPTECLTCPYIISSPTMYEPENISGTQNVYYSMCATIQNILNSEFFAKNQVVRIGCPCLGTGIGGLTPRESAEQIKRAIEENLN